VFIREQVASFNEDVLIATRSGRADECVVAFSGTSSGQIQEWLRYITGIFFGTFRTLGEQPVDLGRFSKAFLDKYSSAFLGKMACRGHLGWWDVCYRCSNFFSWSCWTQIPYSYEESRLFKELRSAQCKKIVWTGHSKGGVFATLASIQVQYDPNLKGVQPPSSSIVTFGEPRTLWKPDGKDRDWVSLLASQKRRYVNGRDLVAGLPPNIILIQPWFHTGNVSVGLGTWQYRNSQSCGMDYPCRFSETNSVTDHFIQSYIKNLSK
jgi:hypothetical protein